ncbi:hypothetical protein JCGZ_24963 [Jatropha curcas]|uniref:Uncharacterized protein n=1 Tax=Jatropha curcas TaxID=180498 RepID=A0A067LA17_JATCU|nr:hypothetical protein JCGZ_24963 [Jatropha curcas]
MLGMGGKAIFGIVGIEGKLGRGKVGIEGGNGGNGVGLGKFGDCRSCRAASLTCMLENDKAIKKAKMMSFLEEAIVIKEVQRVD